MSYHKEDKPAININVCYSNEARSSSFSAQLLAWKQLACILCLKTSVAEGYCRTLAMPNPFSFEIKYV